MYFSRLSMQEETDTAYSSRESDMVYICLNFIVAIEAMSQKEI